MPPPTISTRFLAVFITYVYYFYFQRRRARAALPFRSPAFRAAVIISLAYPRLRLLQKFHDAAHIPQMMTLVERAPSVTFDIEEERRTMPGQQLGRKRHGPSRLFDAGTPCQQMCIMTAVILSILISPMLDGQSSPSPSFRHAAVSSGNISRCHDINI